MNLNNISEKIREIFSWENPTLALPLIGGGLVAIGMNTYIFWWCVFFGIIPFFHFLAKVRSRRNAFWGGVAFGSVVMGGAFAWGWGALPLDWMGISNPLLAYPLVGLLWVFESLVYGGIIGIASIIFYKLRSHTWKDYFLFPSLIVISEWVSALSISLIWWGGDTPIGPHWTLGSIGYPLAESETLRSFAAVGGIYLLSFIAIFLGLGIYRIIAGGVSSLKRTLLSFLGVFFLFVLLGTLINAHYKNSVPEKTISVATTQTHIDAKATENLDDALSQFETLTALLLTINKGTVNDTPAGLVILPEDDRFGLLLNMVGERGRVGEILGTQNASTTLVTSGRTPLLGGIAKSTLTYLDGSGSSRAVYEKSLLMPFGEYIPSWVSFLTRMSGGSKWVTAYENGRGYRVGERREIGTLSDGTKIGGSFCSEIVSPVIFRSLVKDGATMLFNSASHASLHGIYFIKITERHHAQIRAAESNRFLVGATNYSSSFVISNTGKILYSGQEGKTSAAIYPEVALISKMSIYETYGDWVLLLSLFVVLSQFTSRRRLKRG